MPKITSNSSHVSLYQGTLNLGSKAIFDVVLVWPRALIVHLPLLARDIKKICSIKKLLTPHLSDITALFQAIFNAIPSNIDQLRRFTRATEGLADKLEGVTTEKALGFLYQEKEKFQKISAFFHEVSAHMKDDSEIQERDIVAEISQTATLLNALIDDLSSRKGMFSEGKKRSSAQVLQAQALAISVPEKSPLEVEGDDEELCLGLEHSPHEGHELDAFAKKPKPIYVHRPLVVSRPSAYIAPALYASDVHTLENLKKVVAKTPDSFAWSVVFLVNFLVFNVLLGVPRFILYDLPWLIIQLQNYLDQLCDKAPDLGISLIDTKKYLLELSALVEQLDRLRPVFTALEIYTASNSFADTDGFLKTYKNLVVELTNFVETTDSAQVARIAKEFKGMIFKINPMLVKLLDKLHGRSFASMAMPNPFKMSKARGAGSGKEGTDAGLSSGDSSSTPEGVDASGSVASFLEEEKLTASAGAKKFFNNVGKAFKTLAKVPEASSPAPDARKPSGSQ